MKTDKIYLIGFMSAGKTTLARALADRLGWRAEDIDELVEAREQLTIPEIFARRGEPYFRQIEREILHLLLPLRDTVVATGGGTFVDPESRARINVDGLSIWIDVPLEIVLARLPPDGRRPLAGDRSRLEWLYAARRPAYEQAHVRIEADALPPGAVVERILEHLDA